MLIRKNTCFESYLPGVPGCAFVDDVEMGYHGRTITTIEAPTRFDENTIDRLLKSKWWEYGPDIVKGLDYTKPAEIIGEIERQIAEGFPKYTCDKYVIDPVRKEVTRIVKGTDIKKLLYKY